MAANSHATLFVVGTPLNDEEPLSKRALEVIGTAAIVIGESRSVTARWLKISNQLNPSHVFYLDPPRKDTLEEIITRLKIVGDMGGVGVLLSDSGLPILFDPGREVLKQCRKLGFAIRSEPGPTSWGTACCLSGFAPPFRIVGFLPQKREDRDRELRVLAACTEHCVLLETPYRFRKLLHELARSFGPRREIFLAWEIGKPQEWYHWGTLDQTLGVVEERNLIKGEFVVITRRPTAK